jgi:hypothetical protein
MPRWFPQGLLHSNEVIHEISTYAKVCHMKMHMPFFIPVSNRDAVIVGQGFDLSDLNAVLINARSCDDLPGYDLPAEQPGYVRMGLECTYFLKMDKVDGKDVITFKQLQTQDLKMGECVIERERGGGGGGVGGGE